MADPSGDNGNTSTPDFPTRRGALVGAIATMVAAAVARLAPREAEAQNGQPLVAGQVATSSSTTTLENTPPFPQGGTAFEVTTLNNLDPAIVGGSQLGTGVVGASGPGALVALATTTPGVGKDSGMLGMSDVGVGVRGVAGPSAFAGAVSSTPGGETGVLGVSALNTGVMGVSGPDALEPTVTSTGALSSGVLGFSAASKGVIGISGPGSLSGSPTSTWAGPGAGVLGVSDIASGVVGLSGPAGLGVTVSSTLATPAGVVGAADTGYGVHAVTLDSQRAAVLAENQSTGLALDVVGRTRFSTGGSGQCTIHEKTTAVADNRITKYSHVTVILTAQARPRGLAVRYIEVQPGVGFVIHFNRRAREATPFTYLLLDTASP